MENNNKNSTVPSYIKNLMGFFGIMSKKDVNNQQNTMVPAEKDTETGRMKAVKLPSEIQKFYDWWVHQVHDSGGSLKNRIDRYNDLNYMYYNDTIISGAIELYADETVQYDSQTQPIIVNAKDKKVVNYINDFFQKIGINRQSLREISRNLALYGDSFSINSLEEGKGYTDSLVVDVTTVKDRVEFSAVQAKKEMARFRGIYSFINRDSRLKQIADTLNGINKSKDADDKTKYYKSYLFGYQIEDDMFLPPWSVMHFRMYSSQSEFYPFGRPLLINSISPFRQLKASKNLMAMARASKFPKEVYFIKTSDAMTQPEQWEAVNEAREEFQNLTLNEGSKEDYSIGSSLWVPENLLDYKLISNNINIDDIADIELLREDLIMGTRIPKGYLIVDKGSWGTSGQALLQQYKPFGRSVLQIQTAILEQLVQLVKQQFIVSGDYDVETTDFEIEMNFPVVEDSKERINMKTSTLELAKTVMDNLSTALGVNSKLPTDVVKDIFTKYSFLDSTDLDDWINQISDENEKLSESANKRLTENIVKESYFNAKKSLNLKEGIYNSKHYMTNQNSNPINSQILEMLKQPNLFKNSDKNTNIKSKKNRI